MVLCFLKLSSMLTTLFLTYEPTFFGILYMVLEITFFPLGDRLIF